MRERASIVTRTDTTGFIGLEEVRMSAVGEGIQGTGDI